MVQYLLHISRLYFRIRPRLKPPPLMLCSKIILGLLSNCDEGLPEESMVKGRSQTDVYTHVLLDKFFSWTNGGMRSSESSV